MYIEPNMRGRPVSAIRQSRGGDTEVRIDQLGDPKTAIGKHNRAVYAELEASYERMRQELAAEFCGEVPTKVDRDERTTSEVIMDALLETPGRCWARYELQMVTGKPANSVGRCLCHLKNRGLVRQVSYGVWCAVEGKR